MEALSVQQRAALFDEAPCALLWLGADLTILAANAYAETLTGYSREAFSGGLRLHTLLSVAGRIFVQTRLQQELALAGALEEIALDIIRTDGERVPVMLNARQETTADGRPGEIRLAMWRAVAKRAYEAEVPKARQAAEAAGRVKADFLANVSHEIRTPLNGMIGVAAALQATPLSDGQREMVEIIQSSGSTLERLVSDILEISKIEAGGLAVELRPFQPQAELGGVIDIARLRAEQKGLTFRCRLGEGLDGLFLGDAVRLKQILGNLTSNAVKFTERGEISIVVELTAHDGGPALALTVQDTGIGFDEAVGDTLFQRFHQADAGITRKYGGTGLGLSICKGLTDLMKGSITARSTPGQGSVFCVRVPLESAAPPEAEPAPGATGEPGAAEGALRVLLVEDHPTNQKVVKLILDAYDVQLTITENGQEGVDAWRGGGFDVVLMDMQMPVMDGLSATRAIREAERAEPARGRTPVAMLSANAMEHHRREALEAGADLHIAKPVTPAQLLAGIEAAMDAARAAA